jgi:acetyl-CoA C-acetyltransferase
MSRGGYLSPAMRTGARMGDTKLIDMMVATLTDPFGVGHMGITAENLVTKWGITREEQDQLAVDSHRKAAAAIAEGRFKSQIVPIVKQTKQGRSHLRHRRTRQGQHHAGNAGQDEAGLQEGRQVTAGNASGINDGAAFFVLADAAVAAAAGHKPMARLVSYAVAGVPNDVMGEGPIPATKLALKKAGLTLDQMDVIESNEAFAAQAIAVAAGWNTTWPRSTPMAAPSPWATPSAAAAPSSPPRRSMSCSAPAASTRWPPCASAAARALR